MNQTQRNYLSRRLEQALHAKVRKFEYQLEKENEEKFGTEKLTGPVLVQKIKNDEIKLKGQFKNKKKEIDLQYNQVDIEEVFNLDQYIKDTDDFDRNQLKRLRQYKRKIQDEKTKIMDQLYLGDAEDALKMLNKFENF